MNFDIKLINNPQDFKVLFIIRIMLKHESFPLFGHLYYTRNLTDNYNANNIDLLDDSIFDSIKKVYPDSYIVVKKNILIQNELENILETYRGKDDLHFNISFSPEIPYEKMSIVNPSDLKGYRIRFDFIRSIPYNEKTEYINNNLFAEFSVDEARNFDNAIKSLNK